MVFPDPFGRLTVAWLQILWWRFRRVQMSYPHSRICYRNCRWSTPSISSWTPLSTLTAAEVIDGVRAARRRRACRSGPSELQLAVQWALLHPCSEDSYPAGWGWTTLNDDGVIPLAGPGTPAGRPVRPRLPGRRPRDQPGCREAADRRRPGTDLPTPPPLGPRRRRAGPGLAGPDHLPGDPRPVRRGRRVRRPAHLRDPRQGPPGQRRPARRRSPAVLRPRPSRRRRTPPTHQTRRLAPPGGAPATTDVFMTLDTPDAELFDQTISRIAGELGALGDTDTLDIRRARAVGILADPQYALDLLSGRRGRQARPPAVGPRTSTSTSPRTTWTGRVRCRSRSSAPPPPTC